MNALGLKQRAKCVEGVCINMSADKSTQSTPSKIPQQAALVKYFVDLQAEETRPRQLYCLA